MSLKETLFAPESEFVLSDKAIELMLLFYRNGLYAFPDEVGTVSDSEKWEKVSENIKLRIHEKGSNDPSNTLNLYIAKDHIYVISTSISLLITFGEFLGAEVEEKQLNFFRRVEGGKFYDMVFDFREAAVKCVYFPHDPSEKPHY